MAAALATAGVLTLSACGDHVGSAASINGVTISESSVSESTANLVASQQTPPDNGGLQLINREVLTQQIRHQLLHDVAVADGITVTDAQVNAITANGIDRVAGQLRVAPDQVPQAVRDTLTVFALAEKDAKKSGGVVTDVQVTADVLSGFANRAEAVAAREQYLASPAAMDAALEQASAAQQGGTQKANLLQQPALATYGLYSAPAGSIVVINSGGFALARIKQRAERRSDQLAASMQAVSGQQNGQQTEFALAWLALQPHVGSVQVSVNPRFGTWDPVSLQVIPTNSGL